MDHDEKPIDGRNLLHDDALDANLPRHDSKDALNTTEEHGTEPIGAGEAVGGPGSEGDSVTTDPR